MALVGLRKYQRNFHFYAYMPVERPATRTFSTWLSHCHHVIEIVGRKSNFAIEIFYGGNNVEI